MEREAERRYPNETGGVLLGYAAVEDAQEMRVIAQIGPGPAALHKPFRFEPDSRWQQQRIAKAYEQSGRIASYLGDWHSHPRGGRTPSSIDRDTAKKIAQFKGARVPHPLILILHGEPEAWEIAAYRRQRWKLREAKLIRQHSGTTVKGQNPNGESDRVSHARR
jgi:integrative and conjugative element protein (TIGR02256 family)